MKKRIICAVLSCIMILTLMGCSSNSKSSSSNSSKKNTVKVEEAETENKKETTNLETKAETVLIDEENFKHILYRIKSDDNMTEAYVHNENNTDSEVAFMWDNIKINGEPYGNPALLLFLNTSPHSTDDAIYTLDIDNKIDEIKELSFTLIIRSTDNKDLYSKDITWKPTDLEK